MRLRERRILGLFGLLLGFFLICQPLLAQPQGSPPKQGKPALYEFGAGYCYSCKEMEKIMAELKTSHGDQVEFRMVYADKEMPLFQQYKIMLIPTQVFLDASGKEVDRHIGPLTREEVVQKLRELKFISKYEETISWDGVNLWARSCRPAPFWPTGPLTWAG